MVGFSAIPAAPSMTQSQDGSSILPDGRALMRPIPCHRDEPMPMPQLTVWYNTRCPVCDAGIDWQRNKLLALVRSGRVAFKDINEEPEALAAYGASVDDVRRRLHATDEEGRLITGADVALLLWKLTPGESWLAKLLGNRLMHPVTCFGYDRFADVLFAWNKRRGHW
jgi:predicted DCC family thiol-disulfide oxidoreductase YuxK